MYKKHGQGPNHDQDQNTGKEQSTAKAKAHGTKTIWQNWK